MPPPRTADSPAEPVISAFWTATVIERAAARGLAREPLYARVGLAPGGDLDAAPPVPQAEHLRLWAHVVTALDDPAFPMEVARAMRVDDYDVLGLACKTAPDLGTALGHIARYLGLWTNAVSLRVSDEGARVALALDRPGPRDLGMRVAVESSVAELYLALVGIAEVRPPLLRVSFAHRAPSDTSALRSLFEVPLSFDAPFDGLVVARQVLSTPLSLSDGALSRFFEAHLRERAARAEPQGAEARATERVRAEVMGRLAAGVPTLGEVAGAVAMSPRTLQRRLDAEGTSFQATVEGCRRALAERLLRQTQRPIAEVAFLTGFSEPSAFHRAFKRWTGETPSRYRGGAG